MEPIAAFGLTINVTFLESTIILPMIRKRCLQQYIICMSQKSRSKEKMMAGAEIRAVESMFLLAFGFP